MKRKGSMLLAAVTLVALAVPAFASANTPTLFDHTGKVAVNSKILATSTNATTLTSLGLLKCSQVTITARVTHNASGTVRAVGEGTGSSSGCTAGGEPIPMTDLTLTQLHTAAAGSGTINVTFRTDFSGVECHYASTSIPFTYTAGVTNDTLQITNGNQTGTPALCEPGTLNATFTLETESPTGTGAVWIQ